jgi:hypothetical protein
LQHFRKQLQKQCKLQGLQKLLRKQPGKAIHGINWAGKVDSKKASDRKLGKPITRHMEAQFKGKQLSRDYQRRRGKGNHVCLSAGNSRGVTDPDIVTTPEAVARCIPRLTLLGSTNKISASASVNSIDCSACSCVGGPAFVSTCR